ncbi:HXXEE domain-containing protein [Gracilibacillus saliphilus]|uniref:HXXEE domain-containing protein n=1 Tax=Gracilibacillus saliphilus TaxID=543890 RepID=UPI0013D67CD3|nr:HXXEE domain-containing protein [Gracilibacillus saliphilus]
MDIQTWIVSFLIIFMLHNLEEIIMIESWFKKTYPRVKKKIPAFAQAELNRYKDITSSQFSVVVFVFSVIISIFILISVITEHYFIFLGVNLFFALNMFTHPLQSLFLRCYTPGVWTTILLILPYNILLFYHYYMGGILTVNTIAGSLVVMILLVPGFLISHKITEKWIKPAH